MPETSAGETGGREAMSDERLAEIQRHHASYSTHPWVGIPACCSAHASADDVPDLLAEVERLRATDDENLGTEVRPLTKRELRKIGMAVIGPLKYVPDRWDHETVARLYWALMRQRGEAIAARKELGDMQARVGKERDVETRAVDAALTAWAVGDHAKLNSALLGLREVFIWRIADLQVRDRHAAERRVVGEGEVADGG